MASRAAWLRVGWHHFVLAKAQECYAHSELGLPTVWSHLTRDAHLCRALEANSRMYHTMGRVTAAAASPDACRLLSTDALRKIVILCLTQGWNLSLMVVGSRMHR